MTLNIYTQHMDFIACPIVPMSQGQCEDLKTQDVKAEQSPTSLELTPFIFIFFRNQDSRKVFCIITTCMLPLLYIVATHVITLTYDNQAICLVPYLSVL